MELSSLSVWGWKRLLQVIWSKFLFQAGSPKAVAHYHVFEKYTAQCSMLFYSILYFINILGLLSLKLVKNA